MANYRTELEEKDDNGERSDPYSGYHGFSRIPHTVEVMRKLLNVYRRALDWWDCRGESSSGVPFLETLNGPVRSRCNGSRYFHSQDVPVDGRGPFASTGQHWMACLQGAAICEVGSFEHTRDGESVDGQPFEALQHFMFEGWVS